jgi:hypothetical protein
MRPHERFRVFSAAGYRIAFGAGALPGIGAADLRGPVITVGAQLIIGP